MSRYSTPSPRMRTPRMLARNSEAPAPTTKHPANTRALMMPRTPRSTTLMYNQLPEGLASANSTVTTAPAASTAYKIDGMLIDNGGPKLVSVGRYVMSNPGG